MTYAPAVQPRNRLALVSFVLGVVSVGLALVFVFIQSSFLANGDVQSIGLLSAARGAISATIGAGALVTGGIALVGPRPRKPLAAAGMAPGATEVFGVLVGLLQSLLLVFAR